MALISKAEYAQNIESEWRPISWALHCKVMNCTKSTPLHLHSNKIIGYDEAQEHDRLVFEYLWQEQGYFAPTASAASRSASLRVESC